MKIYLAGKFENKLLINSFGRDLKSRIDVELTNNWSNKIHAMKIEDCAKEDYEDIERADAVIAIAPFLAGANSEMGYAMGLGKKVYYLVDRIFHSGEINPAWGERMPLPAGYLEYPYDENYNFNCDLINNDDRGWVVHSIEDIVSIINRSSLLTW